MSASDWNKVIFSDEKKFNLDGPDGWAYYWHDLRKDEATFSTRQQGGGSVMIHGGFSGNGKIPLTVIDAKLNSIGYQ